MELLRINVRRLRQGQSYQGKCPVLHLHVAEVEYVGKDMGTGYPPWVVGMGTYGYGYGLGPGYP